MAVWLQNPKCFSTAVLFLFLPHLSLAGILLPVLERKFKDMEKERERKDAKMLIWIISGSQDVGRYYLMCVFLYV